MPKNPIEEAEAIWDKREGRIVVQNHNLRKIIIGLLIVVVCLTIGLVIQSLKSSVETYVVQVDSLTGQVQVDALKQVQYNPKETEIKYFLSQFIANTRGLPLAPVVYKQHWNQAYAFLTKAAAAKMNAEVEAEKITQNFGKKTVQVNIVSILPMEGSNSYQVRWNEEEFMIGSGAKKTTAMTGIFTVTTIPVTDEETIKVNPLGIYFSDFNWTKDSTK